MKKKGKHKDGEVLGKKGKERESATEMSGNA